MQAILDWCEVHRPDLRPVVEAEKNNDGFILLMTIGFEAGRQFQKDHPDFPMGQPHLYLSEPAEKPERDWIRQKAAIEDQSVPTAGDASTKGGNDED